MTMRSRDRATALTLLGAATLGWLSLAVVLSTVYPDTYEVRLLVAGAIGVAVGVTATPLAWLAAFGRRGRVTHHGDWLRAARRGILVGALTALLGALQVTGTTNPPVVVFAVVLVAFVELVLSYRR